MSEDPAEPRLGTGRGATLQALRREDLDGYSLGELDERIAELEAEISRARAAIARKSSGRAAADALFGRGA